MSADTSGPAFPVPGLQHDEGFNGISMRDYFAAKAMQSMCEEAPVYDHFSSCARDAYKMADAMLEARK